MQNANETDEIEIGDDLVIKKTDRRDAGGTWVIGSLNGVLFNY